MAGGKRSKVARAGRARPAPRASAAPAKSAASQPRRPPASAEAAEPPDRLTGRDAVAVAGVVVAAAIAFAATFSGRVALGDGPETVSGVKTLGVLHAPGYPAYVLAARVFSDLVPVGSWAFRVNLFSVVCATLTVAGVYLLGRLFGASIAGSVIAALALATTASFWFNAGFAKHYAFSGLAVVAGALFALLWQQRGKAAYLVLAGVALGAGVGASWELALIMAAGVVVLVAFGARRLPLLHAVAAGAALVLVAGAGVAFMIWRARQDPAVNWGNVTSVGRVLGQITQRDFQSQSSVSGIGGALGHLPGRVVTYLAIAARDFGVVAIVLAAVGCWVAITRLTLDRKLFLLVVGVANLVAVVFAAGIDHIQGFFTSLFAGGYLIDVLVVLTVLAALGVTEVVALAGEWGSAGSGTASTRSGGGDPKLARSIAVAVLAAVVLVPSVVVHYTHATHRTPALADAYGRRVLSELPPNSVLVVGNYEFSQPMVYRQVVDGQRRDVTVVSADLLALPWYRELLAKRLDLGAGFHSKTSGSNSDATVQLVEQLRSKHPVYLDTIAMALLGNRIGYQADGLVGRAVAGTGAHPAPASVTTSATGDALVRADHDDGLAGDRWQRFPNQFVYYFHQRAHIELAKQMLLNGDTAGVERELKAALTLVPHDGPTNIALQLLQQHNSNANSYIRGL